MLQLGHGIFAVEIRHCARFRRKRSPSFNWATVFLRGNLTALYRLTATASSFNWATAFSPWKLGFTGDAVFFGHDLQLGHGIFSVEMMGW